MLGGLLVALLAVDGAPTLVQFEGPPLTLALTPRHAVRFSGELPDVSIPKGRHVLKEVKPPRNPSPLLVMLGREVNQTDGRALAVGNRAVTVQGPAEASFFALEPFAGESFPSTRLRSVSLDGSPALVVQTLEVLRLEDDAAFLWVVGLNPSARYRITVTAGAHALVVASDLQVAAKDEALKGDDAWGRSRLVLRAGQSGLLPPTDRLALTTVRTPGGAVEVTARLEQVKAGGAFTPRPFATLDNFARQLHAVGNDQLRQLQHHEALKVARRCLARNDGDLECHLIAGKAWYLAKQPLSAKLELCRVIAMDPGSSQAEAARTVLGSVDCAAP